MRSKRPKIDHMAKLGVEAHPRRTIDDVTDEKREDLRIIGRRARKHWECSAGLRCLDRNRESIAPDEVYIEYATGVERFNSNSFRYHLNCALNEEIIQYIEVPGQPVVSPRRQAILAQRKRKEINAN